MLKFENQREITWAILVEEDLEEEAALVGEMHSKRKRLRVRLWAQVKAKFRLIHAQPHEP